MRSHLGEKARGGWEEEDDQPGAVRAHLSSVGRNSRARPRRGRALDVTGGRVLEK